MSLKILLADDNITAQRLGTKILTDAGYEVISVSNGAAAVKKIASEKPDLLILDVYMPGYTGLEVCEKIKQNAASSAVPVLLTATNMEPYNQADGHRVGADGFMIKPFEASDLVAVVQKLASRAVKAEPKESEAQHTVKMAAVQEFSDTSYEEWKSEAEKSAPQKWEVPQEMAGAPALGMDDFATPAAAPEPIAGFAVEPAPAMPAQDSAAPAFAVDSSTPVMDTAAPAFAIEPPADMDETAAFVVDQPAAVEETHSHLDFLHAQAQPEATPSLDVAPAMEPAVSSAPPAEFEPTAIAAAEVTVTPASELETTAMETPEIPVATDPGLVTNPDEVSQFATGFGVSNAEDVPVGIAMPEVTSAPELDSYDETQKIETYVESDPAAERVHAPAAAVDSEMQRAFAVGGSGAAAAPAPSTNAPIPEELVAQFAAELEKAHQERESSAAASFAEKSVAAPATREIDDERVVAAVDRVLERFKDSLRAEMVQAILRELKG